MSKAIGEATNPAAVHSSNDSPMTIAKCEAEGPSLLAFWLGKDFS